MTRGPDRLAEYKARRDFDRTAEPRGVAGESGAALGFFVQKHDARRLHYDFRLEWDGVLLSWAVTRGPSADPRQKRLAVRTEDHPLDYGDFEGTIPAKEYGGGTVMLWDRGSWTPVGDVAEGLAGGNLKMVLQGRRMRGRWALIRMKGKEKRENWLLIKERDALAGDDADALTDGHDTSVKSGRRMDQIAAGAAPKEPESDPEPARKRKGRRPSFREPQLATLVEAAPEGEEWLHETKFDGYRCLAGLGRGGTRFWTRGGKDWTAKFAALQGAFEPLPCDAALIDGEVMAARIRGSAFSSLQKALSDGGDLVFFAFDLLSLDGEDLTGAPLSARRARLAELLAGAAPEGALRMSEHVAGGGAELFAAACKASAEGIVSKRADAPYRGGRSRAWLKVKCTRRQEFVIGGTSPSDKAGRPFASLLVGVMEGGRLVYAGRVGTGFDAETMAAVEDALRRRKTSPFAGVPAEIAREARWVTPNLVCEVAFSERTAEGHLRHASFLGLREDKPAAEVGPEKARDPAAEDEAMGGPDPETGGRVRVAGIGVSSGGRVVFPGDGVTKLDVARHYAAVGERMTEIAGRRPLTLLRCPDGIDGPHFFQKHSGKGWPSALRRVELEEADGGTGEYLYATRTASFVAAAQMGAIEMHMGGARIDRPDRPDRLVFDLDPGEGVAWEEVRRAALDLRGWLDGLGLTGSVLVTGGKGAHVWLPLRRSQDWDAVRGFAKTVAHVMAAKEPDRFLAGMSKAKRRGRIFVDWLRNEAGASAIAPYSLRARPGATVAVPMEWDAFAACDAAAPVSIGEMEEILSRPCPYLEALEDLQTLDAATVERLEQWAQES